MADKPDERPWDRLPFEYRCRSCTVRFYSASAKWVTCPRCGRPTLYGPVVRERKGDDDGRRQH